MSAWRSWRWGLAGRWSEWRPGRPTQAALASHLLLESTACGPDRVETGGAAEAEPPRRRAGIRRVDRSGLPRERRVPRAVRAEPAPRSAILDRDVHPRDGHVVGRAPRQHERPGTREHLVERRYRDRRLGGWRSAACAAVPMSESVRSRTVEATMTRPLRLGDPDVDIWNHSGHQTRRPTIRAGGGPITNPSGLRRQTLGPSCPPRLGRSAGTEERSVIHSSTRP